MMIPTLTRIGVAALVLGTTLAPAYAQRTPAPLTLDELFPEKPLSGKPARNLTWSEDDRYLAYLWNAYDDKGYDLWVYDTKSGKSQRVTTLESFRPFDREIPEIAERYKKDKEEQARRKKLSDDERKKLEEEDKKKERERKSPQKEYSGISDYAWAHKTHELLLVYRGDLYRMKLGETTLTRLTKTRDSESDIRYSKDDTGFLFRRGEGLYKRRFDSGEETQLNPELPNNMGLQQYWLSPDETKLLIQTSRRTGPPAKQVSYITYRERFAQAQTTARETGDDPDSGEGYVFLYDLNDDPKAENKPWEVYKKPAGEAGDIAIANEPFSPDSKAFVLGTWKRDKKEFQVVVGDIATKKAKAVFTDMLNGEHRSPSLSDPFFSPDSKTICLLSEKSGFRHAWLINPVLESATQLTRGDFEVYPLKFTADGKSLIVRSNKEDVARRELYRVALPSGEMTPFSRHEGQYSATTLSHSGERFAANFVSWKQLTELMVGDGRDEKELTESHDPEAYKRVSRILPQRFTYTNRYGQPVHGTLLLPPSYKKGEARPLLIYVYGGPLGDSNQVNQGSFDKFGIYCAETLGYVYATIDPRGTSGYGAVFGRANYEKPGAAQVEDLVDGVKYLQGEYTLDPKRIGIHGWSFGGFQTQMCLYTAPDIFTLGIAGAGPTEWQNYNNWYVGGVIGANKKADELDKFSLTKLAKNLKSPLLLLHGLEDTNVLAQDTIHVYRELLKEGKGPLVELVLDPTGSHGLGGDIKTKERYAIYAGFLERHWGKGKP